MLKLRLFFKSKAMNTLRLFIIRHLSVYYMLIACFAFSLMGAASKLLSEQVSSVEIVLFRNIIGLAFILAALYRHRNFGKGGAPWLFVFRGVIGSLGLLCFFYNIAHIELGTAFTFQKTAPIFIAVFSYFALKEKLSKLGWVAFLLFIETILRYADGESLLNFLNNLEKYSWSKYPTALEILDTV